MNQPSQTIPIHFVISAPRSGSTWLTRALNGHPEIFATEHRLFGRFAEIWKNNDGSSAPRITLDSYAEAFSMHYFYDQLGLQRDQFLETFQRSFVNFMVSFARRRSQASVVIDKITPYPGTAGFVQQQIRKLFPESKIIYLTRDGRDVLTSGTFDWLLKDAEGTDRHRYFIDREPGFVLNRFFDDAVIEKWAGNWKETVDLHATAGPSAVKVTYEAMIENQANELARIFSALGVDAGPEIAAQCASGVTFLKTTGRKAGAAGGEPTEKARKGIVGDWKNYFTRDDARLFERLAGKQLRLAGYPAGTGENGNADSWIERCAEELALKPVQ